MKAEGGKEPGRFENERTKDRHSLGLGLVFLLVFVFFFLLILFGPGETGLQLFENKALAAVMVDQAVRLSEGQDDSLAHKLEAFLLHGFGHVGDRLRRVTAVRFDAVSAFRLPSRRHSQNNKEGDEESRSEKGKTQTDSQQT
jgi:hypothetical protein